MSEPLSPYVLDALFDGLIRACCDCPHQATGHDLQRWQRADEVWYRLGVCVMCPCPGGRDPAALPRRPFRLVRGDG